MNVWVDMCAYGGMRGCSIARARESGCQRELESEKVHVHTQKYVHTHISIYSMRRPNNGYYRGTSQQK